MYNITQVIRLLLTDLKNWVIHSDNIKCDVITKGDTLTNTLNTMNTKLNETFQEANSNMESVYTAIGTTEANFNTDINTINNNINTGVTNIAPKTDLTLSAYDKIYSITPVLPVTSGALNKYSVTTFSSSTVINTDTNQKALKMQYIRLGDIIVRKPKYIVAYTTLENTQLSNTLKYIRTIMEITNCTRGSDGIYTFTGFKINMNGYVSTGSGTTTSTHTELILTQNNFKARTLTSDKIPIYFSMDTISIPGDITYIVLFE